MPGPVYVPGAKIQTRAAPPKPVAKPWLTVPPIAADATAPLPPTVTHVFRAFWHALGTDLPFSINHSRASRRAMRAFLRTHG